MSKSKTDIKGKVKLSTYADITQSNQDNFGEQGGNLVQIKPNGNEVVNIPLTQLQSFSNHPFSVVDDDKMQELVESIKSKGVVSPIIVRRVDEEQYEIISGHRRKRASELAGIKEVPAIIRELDDNEAVMLMVDSNIQRENIRPMELARAFKMRMDAEKRQSGRKRKNSGHDVHSLTADKIGNDNGISGRQVRRYAHLTCLIPEFQTMMDDEYFTLTTGVGLSFFAEKEQTWILHAMKESNKKISANQLKEMAELRQLGDLTENAVLRIIKVESFAKRTVSFSDKELKQYFPEDMDSNQIKDFILKMLELQNTGESDNAK